jgi:sarcosine oxidase
MTHDLVVIGGGVMGLFTAHHAAERGADAVVLERGRIGDPATASFGRTRSFRSDYLDPHYARLAQEAFRLWEEFERLTGIEVLVRCGCMNVAKRSVTPDLDGTYARQSAAVLTSIGTTPEALDAEALRHRFPYLEADVAQLEHDAGVVDVGAATSGLVARVNTIEGVTTRAIARDGDAYRISTDAGELVARSLVIAAGHGTNDVLRRLPGCRLQVPITRDRPREAKYFVPPRQDRDRFTSRAMPVIAYLDAGVYCHPIVDGLVDAVKIGYYNPPDVPRDRTSIDSIASFVEQCMPGLRGAAISDVEDVDGCDYDVVADDDFVLGAIPGLDHAFVGVGWRGTGYKFAPWVGRVLAESAVQGGTVYDIARFDPARFDEGKATDDPSVAQELGTASR